MVPFLKIHYDRVVKKDLVLTSNSRIYTEIAKPTKLFLFTRNKNFDSDNYSVLSSVLALECVGQQKPYLLRSSVVSSGKVVGCKLTLRRKNLYNFLFNLNFRVLPRSKQFEGFGSSIESDIFSFSLKDMLSFNELTAFSKFFGNLGTLHCQLHFYGINNRTVFVAGRSLFLCML